MIYSHRHEINRPVVWVEELNGKQQSYMTEATYSYFKSQSWLEVVPLTTRSFAQYERLRASLEGLGWNSALVFNGARLLYGGVEDKAWTEESLRISEEERPELERLLHLAGSEFPSSRLSAESPFMFYIKSENVEKDYEFLLKAADLSKVFIMRDSRKIYCIPNSLNKGSALARYMKRFPAKLCFAAGDSDFDKAMLSRADICFCPASMGEWPVDGRKICCDSIFSDSICIQLERLRNEVSSLD